MASGAVAVGAAVAVAVPTGIARIVVLNRAAAAARRRRRVVVVLIGFLPVVGGAPTLPGRGWGRRPPSVVA
ncbi:hypothetical protein NUM3379_26710 [Kineococcus sp. NUM-3379]